MNQEEQILVDQEIKNVLEKQAIKLVQLSKDQFLSTLFLVAKKDTEHHPVINLKKLNWYIPYKHFKMEGLFLLKEILQKNNYMCKIDLKDAILQLPFIRAPRNTPGSDGKGIFISFYDTVLA